MARTTQKATGPGPGPTTPRSNRASTPYMSWNHVLVRLVPFVLLSSYQWIRSSNRYTICSMTDSIYTVDEKNPQVQCISVQDTHIVDTGKLGIPLTSRFRTRYNLKTQLNYILHWPNRSPTLLDLTQSSDQCIKSFIGFQKSDSSTPIRL